MTTSLAPVVCPICKAEPADREWCYFVRWSDDVLKGPYHRECLQPDVDHLEDEDGQLVAVLELARWDPATGGQLVEGYGVEW